MRRVDARGDACPLPVVKAKKAIAALAGAGEVEVLVDNEIAVQNLTKMAKQKGCQSAAEKLGEREYRVLLTVGEPVRGRGGSPGLHPRRPHRHGSGHRVRQDGRGCGGAGQDPAEGLRFFADPAGQAAQDDSALQRRCIPHL